MPEQHLFSTPGNTGDVDPSNGDIDPPWILVTKKGYYDKITLIF
jgi:hypothetical protein